MSISVSPTKFLLSPILLNVGLLGEVDYYSLFLDCMSYDDDLH